MNSYYKKTILWVLFGLFIAFILYLIVVNLIYPGPDSQSQKVEKSKKDLKDDDQVSNVKIKKKEEKNSYINYYNSTNVPEEKIIFTKLITKLNGLGIYCFANSSIQCLNNIDAVKKYFSKIEARNEGAVAQTFGDVFKSMGNKKEMVLKDSIKILSDKLEKKEENFNEYSCPLVFIVALISQIYYETSKSSEYKDLGIIDKYNSDDDIKYFDSHPLKEIFAIKYKKSVKYFFLYSFAITLNALGNSNTSGLVKDYFLENSYVGNLPKVLILRTQSSIDKKYILTALGLRIDDIIRVEKNEYKLSSWIVAPNRGKDKHFYAILKDKNNNFIKCNDTIISSYYKKDIEKDVYLVFYERV